MTNEIKELRSWLEGVLKSYAGRPFSYRDECEVSYDEGGEAAYESVLEKLDEFQSLKDLKSQSGCHCELDEGQEPDGCVIDEGNPQDCVHGSTGKGKESCKHWRKVE